MERGWRKATRLSRMPTRGLAVDQLDPGGGELLQRRVDVVDRVGDVVQAGPFLRRGTCRRGVGAERRQQLDVALADVEQDRLDALLLDRLAVDERPSRTAARRARSRRRGPRRRRRRGRSFRTRRRSLCGRRQRRPRRCRRSTRRISAIAASPTSSCSGVGSLVAQWRWISRPGVWKASASGSPWWRSLQANISTAIEAPPRPTPARATGPGFSTSRSSSDRAAGREQHHRHDQVGAAAVVLLRHRGDVLDPLLVGGDRLVLDPVVGGEVAVDQRHHRRHRADRLDQRPRAAPSAGRARRSSAVSEQGRADGGDHAPVLERQPRRRQPPSRQRQHRHRLGQFQRAAQAGHFRDQLRGQLGLALGGDLDLRRRGRAPPPPSGSARGSAARCGAPSPRAAASFAVRGHAVHA